MPRIKHIAIRTPDPEQTAAFYCKVFGLEEVGKAGSGCYLSDGYINLAILKSIAQGGAESPRDVAGYAGIDHLGFMVEDMTETCAKLEAEGARPLHQRIEMNNPNGQSYYELKYRGPDEQVIDVSGSGWMFPAPGRLVPRPAGKPYPNAARPLPNREGPGGFQH